MRSSSATPHAVKTPAPLKIYFDGGCRPNPGRMELAAVTRGRLHHVPDAGVGTSERAEWLALLHALDVARTLGARDVVLIGDAADVVAQALGRSRPSASARVLHQTFVSASTGFARVHVRRVRRGLNLAGIALARGG